jgi:hypothetical protein
MTEDSFDQRTTQSVAELRAAMSGMEAPPEVKSAVLREYCSSAQKRSRVRVPRAFWGAIVACLVLTAAGLYWGLTRNEGTPQTQQTVAKPPEARLAPPDKPKQAAALPRQPVKRQVRRKRRPPSEAAQLAPRTVDFFALPSAPPIDAAEGGSILRVTVPRSAMRSFGIPVDEIDSPGRVTADVMVGSDGVARAVRLVSLRSNR